MKIKHIYLVGIKEGNRLETRTPFVTREIKPFPEYDYVVGIFKTWRGALVFALYPMRLESVEQAEYLAANESDEYFAERICGWLKIVNKIPRRKLG